MKYATILDVETTGLDPATDRCIEVACILYDLKNGAPVASYASLIHAESNAAFAVNRIAPELLEDALDPDEVWPDVEKLIGVSSVVLAHRADFDRSFVTPALRDLRPWVCTKFEVEWPHGKIGDHLVHLALAHGVPVIGAHRAMTDCDILARLLTRVHESGGDLVAMIKRAMRPRVRVVALVSYDDREQAKAAGFAWDAAKREWWRSMPVEDVAALPFKTMCEEMPL